MSCSKWNLEHVKLNKNVYPKQLPDAWVLFKQVANAGIFKIFIDVPSWHTKIELKLQELYWLTFTCPYGILQNWAHNL